MTVQPAPLAFGSHSPEAAYDTEVLRVSDERIMGGNYCSDVPSVYIEKRAFKLHDGSHYEVRTYQPRDRAHDIAVSYTTPWCTDLPGFNESVGKSLALRGMTAIAIGPERTRYRDLPNALGHLSLTHDAHAHHAILNTLDEEGATATRPSESINIGYSRGAMVGFGINALAASHGRRVRYADFTDPCLEHAVGLRDVRWKELPKYLGREVLELATALSHYRPHELPEVSKTVRTSVPYWIHQAATMRPLFSGEAGTFVPQLPAAMVAQINLFENSIFNHARDWEAQLQPLPFVGVRHSKGLHLTGADPFVRKQTADRVTLVQHLIADNATDAEIHAVLQRSVTASL